MVADAAFQASFRFRGDYTRTENAEENPTLGGTLEFHSNPKTMTSWPKDLGCSFDNISL